MLGRAPIRGLSFASLVCSQFCGASRTVRAPIGNITGIFAVPSEVASSQQVALVLSSRKVLGFQRIVHVALIVVENKLRVAQIREPLEVLLEAARDSAEGCIAESVMPL